MTYLFSTVILMHKKYHTKTVYICQAELGDLKDRQKGWGR